MNKQPEPLRLADLIERYNSGVHSQAIVEDYCKAAAELRRLHAENKALNDALQYSMGCHRGMGELAVRQRIRLDRMELQGEQKPLMDEEILHHGPGEENAVWSYEDQIYFARAIESAHGIK